MNRFNLKVGDKINNIHVEHLLTYVETVSIDSYSTKHTVFIFKDKDDKEYRMNADALSHYNLFKGF